VTEIQGKRLLKYQSQQHLPRSLSEQKSKTDLF